MAVVPVAGVPAAGRAVPATSPGHWRSLGLPGRPCLDLLTRPETENKQETSVIEGGRLQTTRPNALLVLY